MSQPSTCTYSSTQTNALTLSSTATENATGFDGEQSIIVAVRLRPLANRETLSSTKWNAPGAFRHNKKCEIDGLRSWSVLPGTPQAITQKNARKVEGKSLFYFDSIFGEEHSTRDVYDTIGNPIVKGVVAGHDGTVFAYGQTGSGKTYTMQGGEPMSNDDGMIQIVAKDLFQSVAAHSDREFSIFVSYMEIYNEKVYELLLPNAGNRQENATGQPMASGVLSVREDPSRRGAFVNCREVEVTDATSLIDQLRVGCSNRVVSSTEMNSRTSRSHAIFRIIVRSRTKTTGMTEAEEKDFEEDRVVRVSVLNLVDLAGSENSHTAGVKGLRQREAGKINQSLLSLSQVINSLSLPPHKRPTYINYRDSKLTRILQSSLSGNALMAVLCCASPSKLHVEETRSTLKFAARAKLVQTDSKINEVVDDSVTIKRLQRELVQAKRSLVALEEREQAAETTTWEATEELRNIKSMLFGGDQLPEFTPRSSYQPRNTQQAFRVSDKSTHSAPITNAMSAHDYKNNRRHLTSSDAPSDGGSFDHSEFSSPVNFERSPGQISNLRTAFDELQRSRTHMSYDLERKGSNDVADKGSSTPKISGSQPPPDEVLVMKQGVAASGGWGYPSLEYQLNSSHQQARFLESKLDQSEELIELLFKDAEDARKCIHQLVFKNVSYISKIKKLKEQLRAEKKETDTLMIQRYNLLKFSMYLALILFFFGQHQLFLVMVMFIWLSLEAYT